jgi:hypothetical protein
VGLDSGLKCGLAHPHCVLRTASEMWPSSLALTT